MILICSDIADESTNHVIDWLKFYKRKYLRINTNDHLVIKSLSINNNEQDIILYNHSTQSTFNLRSVSFFWYRRGDINIQLDKDINYMDYLKSEEQKLKEYIHYYLVHKIPSLGNFYDNNINKLIVLDKAAEAGLDIPQTLVTENKLQLALFREQRVELITKSIDNNISSNRGDHHTSFLATKVKDEEIAAADPDFFYTLFQGYEPKAVELRIFFLKERFYAAAIASQLDEKTATDYRNYNYGKPNRITTFQLPDIIKNKLLWLNQQLRLTSGSIDMILTPTNRYVFLEINPVGQFGQISKNTNYNIEKVIADYIITNEKKTSV